MIHYGLLTLLLFVVTVNSSNILTIIPFPSYSHQQPLLSVSEALARRGHNLTVITTNPPKEQIPNFNVIDISSAYDELKTFDKRFGYTFQKPWNAFMFIALQAWCLEALCDFELSLPQVQNFISTANQTKFDVVLIENLIYSSYLGLVHKIGSPPVINIHTFGPMTFTDMLMGVPVNPAYVPDIFAGYTDQMDFLERVYNTILYWRTVHHRDTQILPRQELILRKHFGSEPPTVYEMEYNKSLLLMSSDFSVQHPQPLPPNYIPIGPLHLKKPKPLTKELEDWMNGADEGVVYFSLGNLMQGTSMKKEWRDAFLKVFAKFPKVRFMWKWESQEPLEGLTDNVLTRKWFPQQDIIAHPKLSVFMTQGGLQSVEEIVHYGVPVLGLPIFGDQRRNMWKLQKEGVAISVELFEVTYENVYSALKKLLTDKSYRVNAKRLSLIANDRMTPPLDTAVWWVEHVIRHRGAKHLRVASLDLTWYQKELIDVYAFLLLLTSILVYLLHFVFKSIRSVLCCYTRKIKNKVA